MRESTSVVPQGYLLWQELLAGDFFGGRDGQPVVMFVDREELDRLAGPPEDGLRSLADAVRSVVDVDSGASMFTRVERLESDWRRGAMDQPPPTLPVLAISVFAASEMRSDSDGAAHNFYLRLAQALFPDGTDTETSTARHALRERGAFGHVADMWQRMDRWIRDQDGAFGLSTIREDPGLSRIGYPLSQALVRRSDRAALTRFFDRMDLKAESVPTAEATFGLLRIWTHSSSHGLSTRFRNLLNTPEVQGYIQAIVHELAVSWDGTVVSAEGLRRLELRLALDLRRGLSWWVLPNPGRGVSDTLQGSDDGAAFEARIFPDAHSPMFDAKGFPPVTPRSLSVGLIARGKVFVAEFAPTQLLAMRGDAAAGGWMSVDSIQAYEEHVLVTSRGLSADVETTLVAAADPGWRRLGDRVAGKVVGDYVIFDRVVFSNQEALDRAIQSLPAKLVSDFHLGSAPRPRLRLGLPLYRTLSRNTYLAGGEPDLELPVGSEPRDVRVTRDSSEHQDFRASMFPIPLSRFGPYTPGGHTFEADGTELRFTVRRKPLEGYEPPRAGSLSWRGGRLTPAPESADVCGAVTETVDSEDPLLIRRGGLENWLADRTGQLTRVDEPEPPDFATGITSMYFDVRGFAAAWLLQKRANGWHAFKLGSREPAFRGVSERDRRVWREAVPSVRTGDWLWGLYVKAWGRFDER